MNANLPKLSRLTRRSALLVIDVQNDFLPGGRLPVPRGDEVIPPLNGCMERFHRKNLPIFATRDWHPPDHGSFQAQGGLWPPHCIAGSSGADFAKALALPPETCIISKGSLPEDSGYSGFSGTDLAARLRYLGVRTLYVGGLATDYCVLNTIIDALRLGFRTHLLIDAVRAVDVHPGDGERALGEMRRQGARFITSDRVSA